MTSLLPPNSTATELALETATARASDIDVPVDLLWRPEACPAALLPWLGWALSVDDWSAEWSDEHKREVIAASIAIHRAKGTVWSIRRALRLAGFPDAILIERESDKVHDGTLAHDGAATYGLPDHWAEYSVVLPRPITIAQSLQARAILDAAAPVRCRLKALDFIQVQNIHNAAIRYDGSYTHGVA